MTQEQKDNVYALEMALRSFANRLSVDIGQLLRSDRHKPYQEVYNTIEKANVMLTGLRGRLVKELKGDVVEGIFLPLTPSQIQAAMGLGTGLREHVEPARMPVAGLEMDVIQLHFPGTDMDKCECTYCLRKRDLDGQVTLPSTAAE